MPTAMSFPVHPVMPTPGNPGPPGLASSSIISINPTVPSTGTDSSSAALPRKPWTKKAVDTYNLQYKISLLQDGAKMLCRHTTFHCQWFELKQHQKMLLDKNAIQETHYEVLNVKEDANYKEIRASYRSAVLSLHPDKLLKTSETSSSNQIDGERFLKVQKAWEILNDSSSRSFYDNELRRTRQDFLAAEVAEDLSLEDMMLEDAGEAFELFYQCRCGDYFSVDSLELKKMGYSLLREGSGISILNVDTLPGSVILPCGSCSLKARLLISMDDS